MTTQEKYAEKNANRKNYDRTNADHVDAKTIRQRCSGISSRGNITFGAFGTMTAKEFNVAAQGTSGHRS